MATAKKLAVDATDAVDETQEPKGKTTQAKVPELKIATMTARVKGIRPGYIPHRKDDDFANQGKAANDEEAVARCFHVLNPARDGCEFGIPAAGFANSILAAGYQKSRSFKGTILRGAFFVLADADGLIPLHTEKGYVTRVDGGTNPQKRGAAVRIVRPCFEDWWAEFEVQYNENIVSPEDLLMLIQWAGFHVGVGDARPEKCIGIAAGRYGLMD